MKWPAHFYQFSRQFKPQWFALELYHGITPAERRELRTMHGQTVYRIARAAILKARGK